MKDDRRIPLINGVNLLVDPLRLDDTEAVKLKNLYPNTSGKMSKRLGTTWLWLNENGQNQSSHLPLNFLLPKFSPDTFVLVTHDFTNQTTIINAGRMYNLPYVNSITATIPEVLSGYRPHLVEYGKRVLVFPGVVDSNGASVWEVMDTGGVLTVSAAPVRFTLNGTSVAPRVACVYMGRMVYGNFGPGFEDTFIFADDADRPYKVNAGTSTTVEISTVGSRSFKASGLAGDSCVVIAEVTVKPVGAPDASALFILGSERAILALGEPLLTDDTPGTNEGYQGTLAPQTLNEPCGCVSAETFVQTPMGLIWASWNDVWAMGVGGLPKRVGTKIRPALSRSTPHGRFLWHAAYHHGTGSYRLAVLGAGQIVNHAVSPITPCEDQWWLDLRSGLPETASLARWYGPQQYRMVEGVLSGTTYALFPGTFIMHTVTRANEDSTLLAVHPVMNSSGGFGFLTGTSVPAFVELDHGAGRDAAARVVPVLTLGGDTGVEILPSQQGSNEIFYEIITKEYDFDDPLTDKVFQHLDLTLWADETTRVECAVIVDGGREYQTTSIAVDQLGMVASVDGYMNQGSSHPFHEYQTLRLALADGARLTGKVFQFVIKDAQTGASGSENQAGWVIVENGINSEIVVHENEDDGGGGVPVMPGHVITIPAGYYTSRDLLMDALIAALNASPLAAGGTFSYFNDADPSEPLYLPIRIERQNLRWWWRCDFAAPIPVTPSSSSLDKSIRRSRKVAAMLGFYSATEVSSLVRTAANNAPLTQSNHVELAALQVSVYHFGRKPSGGKYEPNIP